MAYNTSYHYMDREHYYAAQTPLTPERRMVYYTHHEVLRCEISTVP
jgi:hypothetical protein